MVSNIMQRVRSLSLKWKLVIPFLVFSFLGTITLVYIGLNSQQELIKQEERKQILNCYRIFMTVIDYKKEQALALATTIAEKPEVQRLLADQDEAARTKLTEILFPLYQKLKREFGVLLVHFHTPTYRSFLRLHLLEKSGELMFDRTGIIRVLRGRRGGAVLERGLAGLGIRGIAPVFYEGVVVGTLEVGFPFGKTFLEKLKVQYGPDITIYEESDDGGYSILTTTVEQERVFSPMQYLADSTGEAPLILVAPDEYPDKSILLSPIRDFYGKVEALVEIDMDRSVIKERLSQTKELMFFVGLVGIFVSFILIWIIASLFIRPVKEIVREAREIAEGKRESHLEPGPNDEIGVLTSALNKMLDSLNERRVKIEEYARTLETKVRERTVDLVASEEKYRKLVENLPLIVYRILDDGTTEFVNSYFTQKLGYTVDEVVRNKDFWQEEICGYGEIEDGKKTGICWEDAKEHRVERVVRNKQGQMLTFIDQAIPRTDLHGRVKWIDGFMLDITELKSLQEKALRTEELRTLTEISARFAHEIRNPLATAGGFARRLENSLSEDDPNRKIAHIIVEEVARLEDILKIMLSSIEPVSLFITEVNVNRLVRSLLKDFDYQIKGKGICLVESLSRSIPDIEGDEGLLKRAFETILRHSIVSMPEGETLSLSTLVEDEHPVITIRHRVESLSEEDVEQFFIPRFTSRAGAAVLDLPLSKIIIHRHGGKIDVSHEDGNAGIIIRIYLPIKA